MILMFHILADAGTYETENQISFYKSVCERCWRFHSHTHIPNCRFGNAELLYNEIFCCANLTNIKPASQKEFMKSSVLTDPPWTLQWRLYIFNFNLAVAARSSPLCKRAGTPKLEVNSVSPLDCLIPKTTHSNNCPPTGSGHLSTINQLVIIR